MACEGDLHWEYTGRENTAATVALFRSLGDTTRLAILQRLACGEAQVTELAAALSRSRFTVSGHLSCLLDCGLVGFRTTERGAFYFLAQSELIDLLDNAGQLLAVAGTDMIFEPTHSTSGERGR